MQIETTKKLFTVDDYYLMVGAGILGAGDRVELIDGQIVQMSPIGARHSGCVDAGAELFSKAFRDEAIVRVQNPLRLNNYTEAEPDLVLLKRRSDFYRGQHPEPGDTFLVVEVSDTTLVYDRDLKLPRYAAAGVPEVWIEDLSGNVLLVHRDPVADRYQTRFILRRGETVSVAALGRTKFNVSALLG